MLLADRGKFVKFEVVGRGEYFESVIDGGIVCLNFVRVIERGTTKTQRSQSFFKKLRVLCGLAV